ncbi:ABC transporter substrate-binding protein [Advenella incenata]
MFGTIKRWIFAAWLIGMLLVSLPASAQIEITDQAGRTVRLAQPAQRIFFSEPGDFTVMAMLEENPARRIVAWNRWRLDKHTLDHWRSIDPVAFDKINQMVIDGPQNLNAEMLIANQPDLVVLDHFFANAKQTIARLEQAGIPVAVLNLEADLRERNATEGIEKMAILIGREQRGREVADFIVSHVQRITQRVAKLKQQQAALPTVLMEPHAGTGPCCMSVGSGVLMGDLIVMAGGRLLGSEIVEGLSAQLSAEYVIASDPEVYIGTGGRHIEARGGLLLGPDVDPAASRASLQRVTQRVGIAQTSAARNQRSYGIWHSGYPIVNLELIATWLHPELFSDVDPMATLAQINQRFMAKPLTGTFWITPNPTQKAH